MNQFVRFSLNKSYCQTTFVSILCPFVHLNENLRLKGETNPGNKLTTSDICLAHDLLSDISLFTTTRVTGKGQSAFLCSRIQPVRRMSPSSVTSEVDAIYGFVGIKVPMTC